MKDRMIDMIGPFLVATASVECLSAWSGDQQWASLFGAFRIFAMTAILMLLASRTLVNSAECAN